MIFPIQNTTIILHYNTDLCRWLSCKHYVKQFTRHVLSRVATQKSFQYLAAVLPERVWPKPFSAIKIFFLSIRPHFPAHNKIYHPPFPMPVFLTPSTSPCTLLPSLAVVDSFMLLTENICRNPVGVLLLFLILSRTSDQVSHNVHIWVDFKQHGWK